MSVAEFSSISLFSEFSSSSQMRNFSTNLVSDAAEKGSGWIAQRKWDALVVGGGHNGLTAAAYLARAGLAVAVLERRHVLGGAAVTEEIVPGFKFSRCSYLQSLLRPSVIKELELHKHGMKLLPRNPSSFTPSLDGSYLLMGPDAGLNHSEISKFSKKDADAYPRYEQRLEKFSSFIAPLVDTVPPEVSSKASLTSHVSRLKVLAGMVNRSFGMSQADMVAFMELLLAPASRVLDNWFESDLLKVTLATDAIIGTMGSVDTPGSGYVLLHHVMGETEGARGIWSYVQGGMGSISMAIAAAAKEAGATLVTNAKVDKFIVEASSGDSASVTGVTLEDGTHIEAKRVLSNATAATTFLKMVPSGVLREDFLNEISKIDYQSGTTKLNLAVSELPRFRACSGKGQEDPGPEHRGTIHLGADNMQDLLTAHKDACNGYSSTRPVIEMTIPSALDGTISPPGKHVINMFVQYTPYHLKDGGWEDPKTRESFANRCFDLVEEYAPGFKSSVIDFEMLAPPDLERIFGLTGGNVFHGAMSLDSLFLLRPVKGWSGYKTPLDGLYLCGSGAHPGGGVMAAAGRNAARVVLEELGKKLT
ncbi:pyridine nucleotide-disulfide oxidoreductase domain-containing protein 2 [Selaginella moellendorffii]|uniref:pyridine nucleotide-disulfide oxidoreductase domain-containing protein 2 n=1 Tax=Selaginella moellendorffii TaxID=88036 RepID=UPI000D1C4486|nr:pyridine nucleotide-disulfide oxidoreductase domain-containing protein 2 [Selaginella moellendorffii]|eukprot:XP_024520845.1 pyridine nucleotide-disulfide oxidoreductase domain-containing protein 2 [Selaginella moellendorffii]